MANKPALHYFLLRLGSKNRMRIIVQREKVRKSTKNLTRILLERSFKLGISGQTAIHPTTISLNSFHSSFLRNLNIRHHPRLLRLLMHECNSSLCLYPLLQKEKARNISFSYYHSLQTTEDQLCLCKQWHILSRPS
jgi:hypothetical protein